MLTSRKCGVGLFATAVVSGVVLLGALAGGVLAGPATFLELPSPLGGDYLGTTFATAISADGRYVVGAAADSLYTYASGVAWSLDGAGMPAGAVSLPGGLYSNDLYILPTSVASLADGCIAVGSWDNQPGLVINTSAGTTATWADRYGSLTGVDGIATTIGRVPVSGDSYLVAGYYFPTAEDPVLAWANTVNVGLGYADYTGTLVASGQSLAIPGDGSSILTVDEGGNVFVCSLWLLSSYYYPDYLTPVSPSLVLSTDNPFPSSPLADPEAGYHMGPAMGTNLDGSVIVGSYDGQAVKWTLGGGPLTLALPAGATSAHAAGVSDDGTVVVGFASDGSATTAVFWDETHTAYCLQDALVAWGVDLSGWTLDAVTGVSADGKTLAGYGTYNGLLRGWLATLSGLPSTPGTQYLWNNQGWLFADPTSWDPEGVPGPDDTVLFSPSGDPWSNALWIYPKGDDDPETVIAALTVSGYVHQWLQMADGAVLCVRSNGSPGSGTVHIRQGNLSLGEGELQAVNCFVGESPASGYDACVNLWNDATLTVSDTLAVYPEALLWLSRGTVNAGTLHTYRDDTGPYPRFGMVAGAGTINATTVNNEGTIYAAGGDLDVNGDIVQYSPDTLTLWGGAWQAYDGGTLSLNSISMGGILRSGASICLGGPGASIPQLGALQENWGHLELMTGATFTTAGGFTNAGMMARVLVSGGDPAHPSTFRVAGDLDNTGQMYVIGYGPGGASIVVEGHVAQLQGNTLTGGMWGAQGAAIEFLQGGEITTNQATVWLAGQDSRFDPIDTLQDNQGSFSVIRRDFTTQGNLTSSGSLQVRGACLTVQGDFTQTGSGWLRIGADRDAPDQDWVMGCIDVQGQIDIRGALVIDLPYQDKCKKPLALITFEKGVIPDIQFTTVTVFNLCANRDWYLYQKDTSWGIDFEVLKKEHFVSDWHEGMTVTEALPGFTVSMDEGYGSVTVVSDDLAAGGTALELADLGVEGVREVGVATALHLDDEYLHVRFDWRFLTDGKLKIEMAQDVLLDVIYSPTDWPNQDDAGRDTYVAYDRWFNLTALGFAWNDVEELRFRLLSLEAGDPVLRLGNLLIETYALPEPATLLLLGVGAGWAALGRCRRRSV